MRKLLIFIAVATLVMACGDAATDSSAPAPAAAEKTSSETDKVTSLPDTLSKESQERRPDQIIDTNRSKDQ